MIIEWFDCLSLAAVINKKFFVVHGGISPELKEISQINHLNRFIEIPKYGLFCDILWSDPINKDDGKLPQDYVFNKERKCSYYYGVSALKHFLKKNKLLTVIRAHEVQFEGYKMHNWEDRGFPMVITIFSAPNYCQMYKNKGAIIRLRQNNLDIDQFKFTQSPYFLPNFMNVFSWSLPFVSEKIVEIYTEIYKHLQTQEDEQIESTKFIQVMNNLVQDKDLEVKIQFLEKSKELSRILREKSERQLRDSFYNNVRPSDLDYQGHELEGEFSKIKEQDTLGESRVTN